MKRLGSILKGLSASYRREMVSASCRRQRFACRRPRVSRISSTASRQSCARSHDKIRRQEYSMNHKSGKVLLAAIVLLSTLFTGAAFAQTKTLEEIVAWVNNDIILKSEYEKRKAEIREDLSRGRNLQGAQLEQAYNQQVKIVLQQLIDETLLLQQARDIGLTAENEITKTMDRLRQEQKLANLEELEKAIVSQGISIDDFKQNIRVRYLSEEVLRRE